MAGHRIKRKNYFDSIKSNALSEVRVEGLKMDYHVYIARNSLNQLYIGQTTDLSARISRHQKGRGARFTRINQRDFKIVYSERYSTLEEATNRERQLKGWTRAKKEALIAGKLDLLKKL